MARFESSSQELVRLREAYDRLSRQKRPRRISVHGLEYGLRCTTYDNFGEVAFHLALRPSPRAQPGGASAARRHARRPEV